MASGQPLRIGSDRLRLTFDPSNGALTGIEVPASGWMALGRADLARSFRLLLPTPEQRHNDVLGERQKLSDSHVSEDGRSLRLVWQDVESEDGRHHDIRLEGSVQIDDQGAVFSLHVDNRSDLMVENVYWPYLGDLVPPDRDATFDAFCYSYASAKRRPLWPTFQNVHGYFGVDRPTMSNEPSMSVANPTMPFILLEGPESGLYLGVDDGRKDLVAWFAELEPGYGESISASVPEAGEIGGKPVAIRFAAVHVPYVAPGTQRTLPPIRVAGYQGDWHRGVDLYVSRRRTWDGEPTQPDWARDPHSWQQVQLNSPEDERRYTFADLPALAAECAERGVSAIQVVGWNVGGQDQNNPSHDPDPHLGGMEGLKTAIEKCHQLGVRVILFTKFIWADRATERFRKELVPMAIKDPYGDYYVYPGYRYQTATQLLDINTKRLVPMCFASEPFLRVCDEEFSKVLATGADGMLFDECLHHSPTLACFDETHGHRYGDPTYAHDTEFAERLRGAADATNPDFLFAGEACYDAQLSVYQLSYHRSEDVHHIPLSRYLRPHANLMTALTGFDDRNMVNQCLLYRYVMSYEPYNFKGRLPDAPLTVAYGQLMEQARRQCRNWFWDGTFQDTVGGEVIDERTGAPHHPYAVFRPADGGPLGAVVANYDDRAEAQVRVSLDGQDELWYRLVDSTEWRPLPASVAIPPRSAILALPAAAARGLS